MTDVMRGVSAQAARAGDTWFWRPLSGLCILAVIATMAGPRAYAQVGWLSTAINFYCVLAYGATAALLLSTLRVDARRSIVVLAATAAGMAALAALTTITFPMSTVLPSIVPAGPQTAHWLFALQYVFANAGTLAYALYRRNDPVSPPAARAVARVVIGTTGAVAAIAVASLIFAGSLPGLTGRASLGGFRYSGLDYVHMVLAGVTIIALLRLRNRDGIDRAVLLSVIAIALIDAIVSLNAPRFSISFLILRVLGGASATFVLLAAARRVVNAYVRLPGMQATLDRTERLAIRQSDRLAAVWRLVRDDGLNEAERVRAIVDAGAAALRPGHAFRGTLQRVGAGEDAASAVAAGIIAAGQTVAFGNAAIGTSFEVANTRYVLSFCAGETSSDEPFTDDDLAFVDVLASFIASRLHHERQLAQIRYQIEHDPLTGMMTRSSFRLAATKLISEDVPFAVAVFDLDRFREINETFGHMLGDAILVEIGAGLSGARSGGEIVARLGGDNFGVLIDRVANAVDVEARMQKYCNVFTQPLLTGDRTGREALFVGASVGVALFPQDATAFADVLAGADAAVDTAKARQRGSIAFYDQASEASVQRRRTMRLDLASAIDNGQLELHYQPAIELATGDVVSIEALLRWEHPALGSVGPSDFIPMAEHNTLIRPISSWVSNRALADIAALGPLPAAFQCFLNLSALQLRSPDFIAAYRGHLGEQPAAFHHIAVDVNETIAMQDADRTLDTMAILRELGVEIALDNFGTGYSALSYVTRFPIDVIKIDRSFIERLPGSEHDAALVEVLLGIAQRFGFLTHAAGIETQEQYEWLRQRGCTYGSGFYVARPMRFSALATYLKGARLSETRAVAIRPPT